MANDLSSGSTFYLSPECNGGVFSRLESYNTATNDIWSLGVILVNLTCGRNPWRAATSTDDTFRMFVNNPDSLRNILPISAATLHILKGMFALEPRDRPSLRQIRKQILAVDTFCLTEEQLKTAHAAARAAAAAVRPIAPPPPVVVAPVAPVGAIPPRALLEESFERQHITEPQVDIVGGDGEYAQVAVRGVDAEFHNQHWSQHSSYADLDQDVLNQINYHHQHHHHHQPQVVYHRAQAPAEHAQAHAHAQVHTPSLVGGGDPFALEHISSQSSGDASLPPTPEFNPADKAAVANGAGVTPAWTVAQQKVQLQEPELFHMSPLSPHRQAFNI